MFDLLVPSPRDRNLLRLTLVVLFAAFMFALVGCSTEQRLIKSVNRHGQKESVALILSRYSEYVPKRADSIITIEIPPHYIDRPVLIADTSFDSTLDSFKYVNEWLTLELGRYQGAFFKVKAKRNAKRDTVYMPSIEIPVAGKTVYLPCPDDGESKLPWWKKQGLLGIGGICLALLLTIILIAVIKRKPRRPAGY